MPGLEIYFFIRFIFVFFLVCSFLLMALTVRPLNRFGLVNGFAVGLFVGIAMVVAVTNALIGGYLADSIYPGGDVVSFYLFFVLLFFCTLNVLLYVIHFMNKQSFFKKA